MGIPRPIARLLFEEGKRRPFRGSVLQLGRCYVYLTLEELERWARHDGFPLRRDPEIELSHDPRLASLGCVSDRTFFRALGFDAVDSLDLLDDERPTWVHDLNRPVPAELEGRYDVVFDTGTLIHVFDQRAAFRNIGAVLRTDGRVVHNVPSTNHVDVGFYMHSPQLFADFYAANGWRLETLRFCEFEPLWLDGRFVPPLWKVYAYAPGELDGLGLGGFGARPAATWAVATRLAGATLDRVPLQGCSRPSAGASAPAPAAAAVEPGRPTGGAFEVVRRAAKRIRRRLARVVRAQRPPLVGRY